VFVTTWGVNPRVHGVTFVKQDRERERERERERAKSAIGIANAAPSKNTISV